MSKPYTMKHWKYLMKMLPKIKCAICNVTKKQSKTKRLVWDHNHKTNIIRGVLCDTCNVWLEQYIFHKQYPVPNIHEVYGNDLAEWMITYNNRIDNYLLNNTGIIYSDKIKV